LGDLLKGNGTKFVRFPMGTANQVLAVNSGGTDLSWVSSSASFTASSTDTLTNKSISGSTNTLTAIPKSAVPSATVYTDQANTYGAFDQTFPNSRIKMQNPAATFNYIIASSAITADRTATLPLLTGNDTFVMAAFNSYNIVDIEYWNPYASNFYRYNSWQSNYGYFNQQDVNHANYLFNFEYRNINPTNIH
jgi:hypothetical protein